MTMNRIRTQYGFTLVEAVIVIVMTGILAAMVAVFIKKPIDAYIDTARRAELSDIADTAVRRLARDVQSALPNSVRTDSTTKFLEFLAIKDAGRYRADYGIAGAGQPLMEFCQTACTASSTNFDVFGPPITLANGDWIVIYNQGIPGSDVYEGTSRRAAVAGTGNNISLVSATPFPFPSPGSRFQVVNFNSSVSYVCQPDVTDTVNAANGFLYRYSGYAIQSAQPTSVATLDGLPGIVKAKLAGHVSDCSLSSTSLSLQSQGLISIALALTEGGETVKLQHQVNVNNTP